MIKLMTTLCLLMKGDEVLLALKKRGFGEGKYNGVGGKVKDGETIEEAMIRETQEEMFVRPTKYEKVGVVEFDEFNKGIEQNLTFHLFVVTEWDGDPLESEEMKPEWFNIDDIPYDKMFSDDRYWMPLILECRKIKAHFKFDEDWNLLSQDIEELGEFEESMMNKSI